MKIIKRKGDIVKVETHDGQKRPTYIVPTDVEALSFEKGNWTVASSRVVEDAKILFSGDSAKMTEWWKDLDSIADAIGGATVVETREAGTFPKGRVVDLDERRKEKPQPPKLEPKKTKSGTVISVRRQRNTRVWNVIKDCKGYTTKQISEATGLSVTHVRQALRDFQEEGKVGVGSRHRYFPTTKKPQKDLKLK